MAKKFDELSPIVPQAHDTEDSEHDQTQMVKKYVGTTKLNNLRDIELERIKPDQNQPRQDFAQQELNELADSIKANGIIQPVTVEYVQVEDYYKIHVGERRYRACQLLKLKTIPCIIVTPNDQATIVAQQLIENLQRASLKPLEKAAGLKRLKTELGDEATWQEVESKLGITASFRKRVMSYLQIPEAVRPYVYNDNIARAFLQVKDNPSQTKELITEVKKGISGRQALKLTSKAGSNKKTTQKTAPTKTSTDKLIIIYSGQADLLQQLEKIIKELRNKLEPNGKKPK